MAIDDSPLGDLPEGWTLARLADIARPIGSGATPRGGSAVYLSYREKFALVRSQNVFDRRFDDSGLAFISDVAADELSGASLEADDLLLNITGDGVTFGRSCMVPREVLPACVNQHVVRIRCDRAKCLPAYLLAYMTHPMVKSYVEGFNAGGSRRAITKGHIESFVVPLPPLPEQRAIARVLGGLDDKIELNRRMNRTLEDLARGVFRSWFVDFDPVVKPRPPAGTPARGLARGPAPDAPPTPPGLFPTRLVDSPLGPIPEGWRVGTVGEEFNLTMGQSPPGSTYNEDGAGVPFYQGRTDFGFRFPTRRVYCTAPTRFAEPGDTLVSVRAPVGDINLADERCAAGRGIAAIRHKSGSLSYTYAMMGALREAFDVFNGDGTLFGCIGKTDFDKMQVLVPPPALVAAFEKIAGPWDAQIAINEKQARALAATRDALLPVLLSGEVRLRSGRDEDRIARDAERAAAGSLQPERTPRRGDPNERPRGGTAAGTSKGRA